jgi:hypothetical protein
VHTAREQVGLIIFTTFGIHLLPSAYGTFCRFCLVSVVFPCVSPPVFTVWHVYCFVYDPDERYTETVSSRERTKTVMNKMMMTAVAAIALATGAQAQYYNYDVTIHQDPQLPSFSELMANQQMINQANIVDFRNRWVYQLVNIQRAFWSRAVPGLGAAIAAGNWGAAYSFFATWMDAEQAYEKKYHQPSPAWQAAHVATWGWRERKGMFTQNRR